MPTSPPRYPDAFREEAVALIQSGERSIPQIARNLGINEQTLRNWVKRATIDAGRGAPGELTSDEHAELVRLRRENRLLHHEQEILKNAAVYVAQEPLCAATGSSSRSRPRTPSRCWTGCWASRAGDYAWLGRPVSTRQQADLALMAHIRVIQAGSRHTYGSPRVQAALCQAGARCSRKRVARLMRRATLVGCRLRRRIRTTRAEPTHQPAPNLVARQFTVRGLDQRWVGAST